MATTADLESQKAALLKQLSGAKAVRHGDKSVENRTIDEIRDAIRAIDTEINRQAGTPRRRQIRVYTSQGL